MAAEKRGSFGTEVIWDRLSDYQRWFEPAFKDYLRSRSVAGADNYPAGSSMSAECLELITDLALRGGKRQRVAFLAETTKLFNGEVPPSKLLDAAISVELLQTHLLIHDDIFDDAPLRRGQPSTYAAYKELYPDDTRLSRSLAILAGDIAAYLAIQVITDSQELTPDEANSIIAIQTKAGLNTFHGQIFDFERDRHSRMADERLYELADYKAVRSSTWAPMRIGLVLAGADTTTNQNRIFQYARAVGIAGQLQDDYLGLFGDESTLGKSTTADLAEGKRTLMINHTLEHCLSQESNRLESILKQRGATESEAEWVRWLIRKYKSDNYLIERMKHWADQAQREAESWQDLDKAAIKFFSAMANWFIKRTY